MWGYVANSDDRDCQSATDPALAARCSNGCAESGPGPSCGCNDVVRQRLSCPTVGRSVELRPGHRVSRRRSDFGNLDSQIPLEAAYSTTFAHREFAEWTPLNCLLTITSPSVDVLAITSALRTHALPDRSSQVTWHPASSVFGRSLRASPCACGSRAARESSWFGVQTSQGGRLVRKELD